MDGLRFRKSFSALFQFRLRHLALLVVLCAMVAWWLRSNTATLPVNSGRDLDVAIFGRGFFQLHDSETGNFYYTRNGHLKLDSDGRLTIMQANNSWEVQPATTLPQDWTAVQISAHGVVSVDQSGSLTTQIGVIQLANFMNGEGLTEVLPNLFAQSDDSGPAMIDVPGSSGLGLLQQGWIEHPASWSPNFQSMPFLVLVFLAIACLIEFRQIHRRLDEIIRNQSDSDPAPIAQFSRTRVRNFKGQNHS